MIILHLDVGHVIQANEHTNYPNIGLHVNFWNLLLMAFCFMIEKDSFQAKVVTLVSGPS